MKPFIKKPVLIMLMISCAQFVFSQTITQGIWMAGGSASFSNSIQKGAGNSTTTIEFLPDAGYYLIDDLGVGLNVGYSKTNMNNSSLTSLALGPWIRYYIIENTFVQPGFTMGKLTIDGDFGKAKTTSTDINLGIGYSAWLTNSVALEPVVYYNISNEKDENNDPVHTNSFGLRIGLQVYFGR